MLTLMVGIEIKLFRIKMTVCTKFCRWLFRNSKYIKDEERRRALRNDLIGTLNEINTAYDIMDEINKVSRMT